MKLIIVVMHGFPMSKEERIGKRKKKGKCAKDYRRDKYYHGKVCPEEAFAVQENESKGGNLYSWPKLSTLQKCKPGTPSMYREGMLVHACFAN